MTNLDYPLQVYTDDNFRENFLKGDNSGLLSQVKRSLEDIKHGRITEWKDDVSELSTEDKFKLQEMLKELECKNMDAQEIVDSVGGRR